MPIGALWKDDENKNDSRPITSFRALRPSLNNMRTCNWWKKIKKKNHKYNRRYYYYLLRARGNPRSVRPSQRVRVARTYAAFGLYASAHAFTHRVLFSSDHGTFVFCPCARVYETDRERPRFVRVQMARVCTAEGQPVPR